MDRRSFLAAAASGVTLGVAGCTDVFGPSLPESAYDVGMRAAAFVPATVSIAVDDTLVWGNNNDRPHTVTAYGEAKTIYPLRRVEVQKATLEAHPEEVYEEEETAAGVEDTEA